MRILLEVEWGETPFATGPDAWPSPLIRPSAYPEGANPVFFGEPVEAPDDLLDRWQKTEQDFLRMQAELQQLAIRSGDVGPGELGL